MAKDIIVKISDSATVKAKNDIARYTYTAQSFLSSDAKKAYDTIVPTVVKVKHLLGNNNLITNIKIDYNIDAVWEYEPKKKLMGYKAFAYINYDFMLDPGRRKIKNFLRKSEIYLGKPMTEEASALQRNILTSKTKNVQVLMDGINYTLSEPKRKEKKQNYLLLRKQLRMLKEKHK